MSETEYTKAPYLPPAVEVYAVTLEKGFALSLRGDSDGQGPQPSQSSQNPQNSQFGQYWSGENWTDSGWGDEQ